MKASELIGKKAIRTAPTKLCGDGSFDDSPITILNVTSSHIVYTYPEENCMSRILSDNRPRLLDSSWLDDNWADYDEIAKCRYKAGDKVKVTGTKSGCTGAEGIVGTITNEHHSDGLCLHENGINVRLENGRVWRINADAKLETYSALFGWDAFRSGKIAVHCDTEDKAIGFESEAKKEGFTWRTALLSSASSKIAFQKYGADLCISNWCDDEGHYHFQCCPIDYYIRHGYNIIDYSFAAAPQQPLEPIATLYCVKDDPRWLTKGKMYEINADGRITYDDGHSGCPGYKSFSNYASGNPTPAACLVECVRRPAEIGEWIVIVDAHPLSMQNYKNGDIFCVTNSAMFVGDVCVMGQQAFIERVEYAVLVGYRPEPEPEKFYNGKVVCTDNRNTVCFTAGKIYEFKDGFVHEDGGKNYDTRPVKTLADAEEKLGKFVKFIEFKGEQS